MKMKRKFLAALLAVCLMLVLSSAAFAEDETFNAYLEVTQNEDGSVSVTIPAENEAVLTAEIPTLSIPCTMLDPVVTHDDATISSTVQNGAVSFSVAEPGVYTITDSSAGLSAMVKSYSLTLEGQIGLNFRVQIPEDLLGRVHAVLVYKGTETAVEFGSPLSGTTNEYRVTFRVPAKEIGNPVGLRIETEDGQTVPLVNSGGAAYVDNTAQYSVADYCTITNVGQYDPNGRVEQLNALVSALQNYGAYALAFFNSGDADPGLASTPDFSSVILSDYDIVKDGAVEGLSQTSMFLTLESETTINLRFEVADGHSIEEYIFRYGDTALSPEENNGSYLIRISNIPAKDLGTPITVKVTSREETLFTVTCSALTYAQLVLNNSTLSQNTALCKTVKAMYLYNQAAIAYFEGGT